VSENQTGGGLGPAGGDGFGRLLVERSGGIGGMLVVWEVDIDASSRRDELGARVAELPWSDRGADGSAAADDITGTDRAAADQAAGVDGPASPGADRFAYLIESRFGRVRFGEGQMPQEWKRLVDEVREVAEPQRRRPG
jgi:hypothetical protein